MDVFSPRRLHDKGSPPLATVQIHEIAADTGDEYFLHLEDKVLR